MGFSVRHSHTTHTTRVVANHTIIMLTNFSFRFPSPSLTSVIKQFFLIFYISKDLGNNAKEWFGKRCSSKGHTTGQRNVIENTWKQSRIDNFLASSASSPCSLSRDFGLWASCFPDRSPPRSSRSCFGRYWYRRMFFPLYDFFLRTCVWAWNFFLFLKCCKIVCSFVEAVGIIW